MAYTPPSGDAVDFTGSGIIVSGPHGDQVDFVTYPATLARSALVVHLVVDGYAFQQRAESSLTLVPTITASANHQFPSGALVVQPAIAADVTLARIATAALSVRPVVSGVAASGKSADAALTVVPIPTGIAAYVYKADCALTVHPIPNGDVWTGVDADARLIIRPSLAGVATATITQIADASLTVNPTPSGNVWTGVDADAVVIIHPTLSGVATATVTQIADAALFVRPTISAVASIPGVTATCSLQVKPTCAGVAAAGVIANAALVVHPIIIARTDKDKFVSADFYVLPSIAASSTASVGTKARASGKLYVRPTIQAGASV